jgi:hypothetical protein
MLRSSKGSLSLRSLHQYATPISFFLIWSPKYLVSSTGHKAPRYVVFSIPLLPPHSSLAQTPWLRSKYTKQLLLCILTFYSTCSRTQLHTRMHIRRASHFKQFVIWTMKVWKHFLDNVLFAGDLAILRLRQSFSHQPLTAQASVQSQASPGGCCGGQSFTATHFSPSTSFFQSVSFHRPLHSPSCIYHQCNITSAQHNSLVNTAVSQTLLQSLLQHSP